MPDAAGHWLHEGTWDRIYVPMGVAGLSDGAVVAALRRECETLQNDNERLRQIAESAMAWQRRSWFTRAFHRWRPPGARQG